MDRVSGAAIDLGRVEVVIGLGGEEVLRRLKAINPNASVLLSSGYNEVEVIQRFTGQGLAGFIQKPYSAAALATAVRKILDPDG